MRYPSQKPLLVDHPTSHVIVQRDIGFIILSYYLGTASFQTNIYSWFMVIFQFHSTLCNLCHSNSVVIQPKKQSAKDSWCCFSVNRNWSLVMMRDLITAHHKPHLVVHMHTIGPENKKKRNADNFLAVSGMTVLLCVNSDQEIYHCTTV
jgi:hypothetical protein